jgi:hypothetical protein
MNLAPIPHATTNEKLIVGKLVADLLAAGFNLSVYDGEEYALSHSTDADAIYKALASTDTDRLYAYKTNERRRALVLLVWGNDVDVISDYSVSLEPHITGANHLADTLDARS